MKNRELLEMDDLGVTDEIREIAYQDKGEKKTYSYCWGETSSIYYENYEYMRAGVQDEILKVKIYLGEDIRRCDEEPKAVIFLSKNENRYKTYLPKERKWSRAKIENLWLGGYSTNRYLNYVWIKPEEKEAVTKYLDREGSDRTDSVYRIINDWQTTVMHRREINEIDRVMDQVTESPADFGQWVREEAFWRKQYIFYDAQKGEAYCTACRQTVKTRMKSVHNKKVICPGCGRVVTAKSWKKQKYINDNETAALIQKIPEGYIIRSFRCSKNHKIQNGWKEEVYFREGERILLDKKMIYVKGYEYTAFKQTGKTRWCNSCYTYTNTRSVVYYKNLPGIRQGTDLRDIPLEKMLEQTKGRKVDIKKLLHPEKITGFLIFAGLTRLAIENMDAYGYIRSKAKSAGEAMRIDGNRIRRLKELNGGLVVLGWLQYEQETGKKLRQDLIVRLDRSGISRKDMNGVLRYGITPERALNYIEKQKGNTAAVLEEWKDYLDMAEKARLNMGDDIVRFPKNMKRRHNELVELHNRKKELERLKGYQKLDDKIRKQTLEITRYYWQDKEYMIVPALRCEDLMREGRILHHCVGASSRYMEKMAKGISWILFLRKKEDPDLPYYTLEIDMKTDEILQWYSEYDRKPDREKIQKVLNKYKKSLKRQQVKVKVAVGATA